MSITTEDHVPHEEKPDLQFWFDDTEPRHLYLSVNGNGKQPIEPKDFNGPSSMRAWFAKYGHDTSVIPTTCKDFYPWIDKLLKKARRNEVTLAILQTDADEKEALMPYFDLHIMIDLRRGGYEFLAGEMGDYVRVRLGERKIYFKWHEIRKHFRKWNMQQWEVERVKMFIVRKGGQVAEVEESWFKYAYWVPLDVFDELLVQKWTSVVEVV